jgi:hypothetical protein
MDPGACSSCQPLSGVTRACYETRHIIYPIFSGLAGEDARRSGGRCPNTYCSWFAPIAMLCFGAYLELAAPRSRSRVAFDVGIYATLNLTRASVPAAKVADTTGASSTQCCRHWASSQTAASAGSPAEPVVGRRMRRMALVGFMRKRFDPMTTFQKLTLSTSDFRKWHFLDMPSNVENVRSCGRPDPIGRPAKRRVRPNRDTALKSPAYPPCAVHRRAFRCKRPTRDYPLAQTAECASEQSLRC